jgi:hypothetical protein
MDPRPPAACVTPSIMPSTTPRPHGTPSTSPATGLSWKDLMPQTRFPSQLPSGYVRCRCNRAISRAWSPPAPRPLPGPGGAARRRDWAQRPTARGRPPFPTMATRGLHWLHRTAPLHGNHWHGLAWHGNCWAIAGQGPGHGDHVIECTLHAHISNAITHRG